MSQPTPSRQLPVAAASKIRIEASNRSASYAAHWLSLLGGGTGASADTADIVIVGGDVELAPSDSAADCVIRVWDFQVGRAGSGALASAVAGPSSVIGHPGQANGLLPADMPEKWCGAYGVILALAELWRRRRGDRKKPVTYDVSAADVMRAFSLQNAGSRADMTKNWRRNGRLCVEHGGIFPMGFFACRDGHVAILGRSRRDWRNIRKAIGDPAWAEAAAFEDPFQLARDSAEADALLETTLAAFGRDELLARGLAAGAVIAPVYTKEEARERGVFREHFISGDGPAMPFLVEDSTGAPGGRLSAAPAITANDAPLSGLRIIELCWVWSGPMVGQILADLGAEVIKVETPARFDLYRTRGVETLRHTMPERARIESSIHFHSLNRNKIGLALDLKRAEGVDVAKRLAACSDLIIENFTVGTMDRLGLGREALGQVNPGLVQLSMSGPGRGSAVQELRSYGLVLSALAGAEGLIRDGDGFLGSPTFSISDPNAATFAAMTALAGVLATDEDNKGRAIDLSQIEAAATLAATPTLPPTTLDAVVKTDDGSFIAVSVPETAFGGTEDLHHAFDGAPFTDIVDWCTALGGQAEKILHLDETDDAPAFADCSGWLPASHPYTGDEMLVAAPWRIDGRRPGLRKPAPLLGEGDDFVLRRVLSMQDDEIEELTASAVVGAPVQAEPAPKARKRTAK